MVNMLDLKIIKKIAVLYREILLTHETRRGDRPVAPYRLHKYIIQRR
jgi:hypothetical protein